MSRAIHLQPSAFNTTPEATAPAPAGEITNSRTDPDVSNSRPNMPTGRIVMTIADKRACALCV